MFFVHWSAICNIHKLKRGGGLFRIDPNQKNPNCNSAFFKAGTYISSAIKKHKYNFV